MGRQHRDDFDRLESDRGRKHTGAGDLPLDFEAGNGQHDQSEVTVGSVVAPADLALDKERQIEWAILEANRIMSDLNLYTAEAAGEHIVPPFALDRDPFTYFYGWAVERGRVPSVEEWFAKYNRMISSFNGYVMSRLKLAGLADAASVEWTEPARYEAEFAYLGLQGNKGSVPTFSHDLAEVMDVSKELAELSAAQSELDGARDGLASVTTKLQWLRLEQQKAAKEDELAAIESQIQTLVAPMKTLESISVNVAMAYATGGSSLAGVTLASKSMTMPGKDAAVDPGDSINLETSGQGGASRAVEVYGKASSLGLSPSAAVEWLVRQEYAAEIGQVRREIRQIELASSFASLKIVKKELEAAVHKVDAAEKMLEAAVGGVKRVRSRRLQVMQNIGLEIDKQRIESRHHKRTMDTVDDRASEMACEDGLVRGQTMMNIAGLVLDTVAMHRNTVESVHDMKPGTRLWDEVTHDLAVMPTVRQAEDGTVQSRWETDASTAAAYRALQLQEQLRTNLTEESLVDFDSVRAGWVQLLQKISPHVGG